MVGIFGKEVINGNYNTLKEKEDEILNYAFVEEYNSYYYYCIELDKIIKKDNMTILTDDIDIDNNLLYILDYLDDIVYLCDLKYITKKYLNQIISGRMLEDDRISLKKYILSKKSEPFVEYKERKKIQKEFYNKY